MNIATQAAQLGVGWDTLTGSVTVPIYQTATFRHPGLGQSTGFDYSRSRNPTRQVLEDGIAHMEGASKGFAFASGMAAIASLLLIFKAGDHLVVTEDLYGGTYRLLERCFRRFGLGFTYVDTTDLEAVKKAVRPETRALFVESLTNPLLKVADIAGLSAISKQHGLITIVDNTFFTPFLLRPLDLGADVTMYSGTKYLAGHNDTICGLLTVKDVELAERVAFHQNAAGAVLGPQDSWLTIRGMKTLSVRLERQQENAGRIARWLAGHPKVRKVYYPGLADHPGHQLAARQGGGFGAMVSFEVADRSVVERLLGSTSVISFAESLGGVETLITFPAVQTHSDIEPETRERLGITETLLRLSVGIEDAGDLISDLEHSLG